MSSGRNLSSTVRTQKLKKKPLHPTKNLSLMTREKAQHQPVRLRERYPEPQRQVSQKRLPKKPPLGWRARTRRERNP